MQTLNLEYVNLLHAPCSVVLNRCFMVVVVVVVVVVLKCVEISHTIIYMGMILL